MAVGSDYIENRIAAAELFFGYRSRERHQLLCRALLDRGYLIVLIEGRLHVLAELKPRELLRKDIS